MPRKPIFYLPVVPVHIVQRGHCRAPVFFEDQANGLGRVIKQWTPHPEYQRLGRTEHERQFHYRQLMQQDVDAALINEIRKSAQAGLALGSDRFKDQIEALGNRRQRLLKPGPKEKICR